MEASGATDPGAPARIHASSHFSPANKYLALLAEQHSGRSSSWLNSWALMKARICTLGCKKHKMRMVAGREALWLRQQLAKEQGVGKSQDLHSGVLTAVATQMHNTNLGECTTA
eukprot:1149207-Pelagomonas_calceolata.AAC.3